LALVLPDTIKEEELIELVKKTKLKNQRTAFILGFYQCMRVSEVANLQKEDIDFNGGFIRIKQGKGSKDRDIPIMKETRRFLQNVPVGIGKRGLQKALKIASKKILNKDIHFHTLRHSGATHYLNVKKVDIRFIQALLGHAQLSTTQIYTHVNPQSLRDAFDGLD